MDEVLVGIVRSYGPSFKSTLFSRLNIARTRSEPSSPRVGSVITFDALSIETIISTREKNSEKTQNWSFFFQKSWCFVWFPEARTRQTPLAASARPFRLGWSQLVAATIDGSKVIRGKPISWFCTWDHIVATRHRLATEVVPFDSACLIDFKFRRSLPNSGNSVWHLDVAL